MSEYMTFNDYMLLEIGGAILFVAGCLFIHWLKNSS